MSRPESLCRRSPGLEAGSSTLNQFRLPGRGEMLDYLAHILRFVSGCDQQGVVGFDNHQVANAYHSNEFLRAVDIVSGRIDRDAAGALGYVVVRVEVCPFGLSVIVEGRPRTKV